MVKDEGRCILINYLTRGRLHLLKVAWYRVVWIWTRLEYLFYKRPDLQFCT